MEIKTFIRKKGIFTFKKGSEHFMTYDPEIRATCEDNKVIALQFQASFDEDDAKRIVDLGIFPEIELPTQETGSDKTLYIYLNGNNFICKCLQQTLNQQPFMNPVEAVVYGDIPMLPFFCEFGFYELLAWKVRGLK